MPEPASPYVSHGAQLSLSNLGQLELLRGMNERGVPLRTTVRGFSMHPFIKDQDVLTISPIHDSEPQVGDVVAFIHPHTGKLVIHRVITRTAAGWQLKGDNSTETDLLSAREHIIGRVTRIERKGQDVRLGLGLERRLIAALTRYQILTILKKLRLICRRLHST
ncbi:MAG: S24/S26 family peptidase [Desulfatiglandales bacterium]